MSLKNDIERKLDVPVRVRAGAPGSLTVRVDGESVYSKKKTEPFPNSDEIIKLIRARTAN